MRKFVILLTKKSLEATELMRKKLYLDRKRDVFSAALEHVNLALDYCDDNYVIHIKRSESETVAVKLRNSDGSAVNLKSNSVLYKLKDLFTFKGKHVVKYTLNKSFLKELDKAQIRLKAENSSDAYIIARSYLNVIAELADGKDHIIYFDKNNKEVKVALDLSKVEESPEPPKSKARAFSINFKPS